MERWMERTPTEIENKNNSVILVVDDTLYNEQADVLDYHYNILCICF